MPNIDAKYESWKNKLLDLGKRNKLLYYKDTARSSLTVTSPSCFELFDKVVNKEEDIVFPLPSQDEDGDESVSITINGDVHTNKSNKDLFPTLRNLKNRAKTALEEQGINMLYLCFGFLQWTEVAHSTIKFKAPLLLVPVTLNVESITSPYVLHLHEDEIVINPTLDFKLVNDYGIKLPQYDENESLAILFEKIRNTVRNNGWTVEEKASLCMLSFLKINMYDDLNTHGDAILSNDIIKALAGDTTRGQNITDDMLNYDFDKRDDPKELFQIIDADSSQQEAILFAKKGISFVLQGPPGTGKSQTITNIIAESLASGKKVLFVSEKMAALEVVHKRLTAAGLNDFCLVMHSHKANKREIMDQLDKSINLSDKKVQISEDIGLKLNRLKEDRRLLDEYCEQIHRVIEPLGKTIYEANGKIANLNDCKDISFDIPDIRQTSRETYSRYVYVIQNLSHTLGGMTCDFENNPWRNANHTSLTHEMRSDLASKFDDILPRLHAANKRTADLEADLGTGVIYSVNGIKKLIELLLVLNQPYNIPSEWIYLDDMSGYFDEVEGSQKVKKAFESSSDKLLENCVKIKSQEEINVPQRQSLYDVDSVKALKTNLDAVIHENSIYNRWNSIGIETVADLYSKADETAQQINSIKTDLLSVYEKSIFDIDYSAIRARIRTEYTSVFKVFKKEYKNDKKQLIICRKETVKKISDEELTNTVEKLYKISELREWFKDNLTVLSQTFSDLITDEDSDYITVKQKLDTYSLVQESAELCTDMLSCLEKLNEKAQLLNDHFRFLFKGMETDWDHIHSALKWTLELCSQVQVARPSKDFVDRVCGSTEFAKECYQKVDILRLVLSSMKTAYDWFVSNFEDAAAFDDMSLESIYDRVEKCSNGLKHLEEWIDYRKIKNECESLGLSSFLKAIEENQIKADNIENVFNYRFFRLWLDSVLPEHPAVADFRRVKQDERITEFRKLDNEQFSIARARRKQKLINALPSMDHFTRGNDEISILKKELKKKRKIMPLRKLFKEIPNLLLTLKPCLMMSPLSVSLFLEADTYKFDVVIFDEASQVHPENAIGAIARGKQVIIAGDSKQLPPTNFFQANTDSEYDDDSYDDVDAFESILDEANMLPERTLQWHYRSRQESLIAFSNAKIYKNRLITFPSNTENARDNGVEFVHVAGGYYDRGGRKGNVVEAKRVAEMVFEHFKNSPKRSLGVITFGENQHNAIDDALRSIRRDHPEFEHCFSPEKEEAFFVKSLENVQGDERDTIIFSIGYAPDINGVFHMNFGPLGKAGGERRLNVAITRAKFNIKLVSSFNPIDIDVDRISSEGPKLLKAYMEYAKNGPESLQNTITESDVVQHDSPFEESVYNFLDRKGYKLATQVGCSGYRIDMAVKHPSIKDTYVLGIECDGATYHSARTARERDRLRQDVLEKMGWKIYRIWSTDWIKDAVTEGNRLVEAVDNAISTFNSDEKLYTPSNDEEAESYITVEKKHQYEKNPVYSYGFETKQDYSLDFIQNNTIYDKPKACIGFIIEKEYPIHFDELCQKTAFLYNYQKATKRIREAIAQELIVMIKTKRVKKKGDFLYPYEYDRIHIRLPNERSIQHISEDEITTAMAAIIPHYVGADSNTLFAELARVYGFSRLGQNIKEAFSKALDTMISQGVVIEESGKLRLSNDQ